jgi:pimeloyl-ACP methyl ester carboxylesterase
MIARSLPSDLTLVGPSVVSFSSPMSAIVTERVIGTNGVQPRTLEAGRPGDPVVVLAHGFPELAYSWRHQIPELAAAGYHVLAPDQRGYGGTDIGRC